MAIVAGDFEVRLSGGAGNADVNASLGGVKSSVEVVDASLHNLFDVVSGAEAVAGDVEYRCVYLHNANGVNTMLGAEVFIDTNTPSPGTAVAIGVGSSAVNGNEQTVADESTAPAGVTFSAADGVENGLALGDIPPGQHRAIWIRRTVTAGAAAYNNDGVTLGFVCETLA